MPDWVREYWAVITGFVAVIVWAVRAEAGMRSNTKRQDDMQDRFDKEIRNLWRQRREDMDTHIRARAETNEVLAEMRADIKTLLSRGEK